MAADLITHPSSQHVGYESPVLLDKACHLDSVEHHPGLSWRKLKAFEIVASAGILLIPASGGWGDWMCGIQHGGGCANSPTGSKFMCKRIGQNRRHGQWCPWMAFLNFPRFSCTYWLTDANSSELVEQALGSAGIGGQTVYTHLTLANQMFHLVQCTLTQHIRPFLNNDSQTANRPRTSCACQAPGLPYLPRRPALPVRAHMTVHTLLQSAMQGRCRRQWRGCRAGSVSQQEALEPMLCRHRTTITIPLTYIKRILAEFCYGICPVWLHKIFWAKFLSRSAYFCRTKHATG